MRLIIFLRTKLNLLWIFIKEAQMSHTFHIPVMGLCYTVDTPLKVAKFGINSVVSIIEDTLIEKMRMYHSNKNNIEYTPITNDDEDYRAKRITSYLNLMNRLIKSEFDKIMEEDVLTSKAIKEIVESFPDDSEIKKLYNQIKDNKDEFDNLELQAKFISLLNPGSIDVNIMTKCDNFTFDKNGERLPEYYSDAHSALRGYAQSDLESSVVFSAGLNPKLYSYCATFEDFLPDKKGKIKKKIIVKVSDYRSAYIQGKFLAKKGLIVSEFRIESGLNCGGHSFISEGVLLGPVLEEFKMKREALRAELIGMCNDYLEKNGKKTISQNYKIKLSVQGGVGTSQEHNFLIKYYGVDSVGWGSPFLLVPEVTLVDEHTRELLSNSKAEDYYLSNASPLGVKFNNFKPSTSVALIKERIAKNRPGSPCVKKYLAFNTEFTEKPICVASREYQSKKIASLKAMNLKPAEYEREFNKVVEKECLCEGLSTGGLLTYGIMDKKRPQGVAVCPGPNLAYFKGTFTLKQMIDHIYGRTSLLDKVSRPNMFINEIALNIKYLKNMRMEEIGAKDLVQRFTAYKLTLLTNIQYYKEMVWEYINKPSLLPTNFLIDLYDKERELLAYN